jgi:hypothetical protein
MTASHAAPLPVVLSTTARAGIAPVSEPVAVIRGPVVRRLLWAADIVGTLAVCLIIPAGIFIVGIPIALAVRAILYLTGQL